MRFKFIAAAGLTIAVGGCATVPKELAGENFAPVTPQEAVGQHLTGQRVRWGGEIIKVEPRADHTCIEVLSRELYGDARPKQHDASGGRFIACGKGFSDPAIYTEGRDLTVTGYVSGTEQRKVGEYDYVYAKVDADQMYLWPQRNYSYYGSPYWYDPFWGPGWGPYWGWGYGYGWYAPPVVIVNPGHHHH